MGREPLEKLQQILGPKFELDFLSRTRRYYVYRADKWEVSDDEISQIIAELLTNGFFPNIQEQNGQIIIHITAYKSQEKTSRLWIHIVLFLLTIGTTMMAGAQLLGYDVFHSFSLIVHGWKYSLAILLILTSHEMGHYLFARHHGMKVTLPYYLPLPLPGFHFGTLGAFIKIKSPIPNRSALLNVGAFGPLSGFVVSLFFLIYGYAVLPDLPGIIAYVEKIHPWNVQGEYLNLVLGKSLLFAFFNDIVGGGRLPMSEMYHFPFIFAGWVGLLVTAINLIPIGQLDGGHILYALIGRRAKLVGVGAFVLMLLLNFVLIIRYFSFIWVMWIVLIYLLIGFRHPPTMDDSVPLSDVQRVIGWFCLLLFILCFTPLPIYIT